MITVADIRAKFLNYFADQGHSIVSSSPLVPRNDPTLMFTNSGMVQFKNVFTGQETRLYTRATTAQKSVRAGGKHNDLENVGYTARHHTFFEMLGNFSFGDYFKDDAIAWAWQLITKEFGLDAKRLCVTVYHDDEEAVKIWKKVAGLSDDKIIRIATSDNFWSMGDTGPCGPCSEIFYDHGDHIWGGPPGSKDEDGDRFIEIWNLVFMQYEQVNKATRIALPKPSIDTGMGLERLAAVLQGKHDNYDIDLLRGIIEASAQISGTDPDGEFKTSHRVIADHLRSSCFLIADGVLPSNEGRGYVLRRIMRRAMRHAHQMGCTEPHMYKLVPTLLRLMGDAYPELYRAESLIRETLRTEETRFKANVDRGLKLLDEETNSLSAGGTLSGQVAFKLYDTYGFPLDLTRDVLRSREITVDDAGFAAAMAEQKTMARAAWSGSGEAGTEKLWYELKERLGATEFLGYDTNQAEGVIQAIIKDGQVVETAQAGDTVQIIVSQTPFYGESGGQLGDTGLIIGSDGAQLQVTDTQKKLGSLFVHFATLISGTVKTGDAVQLQIDTTRRQTIRAHHSATHLLHEALREALGTHVTQKGSMVAPDRLRFDISHPIGLKDDERASVEAAVNARILGNSLVVTRLMTPDAAVAEGAMALFGEKYGDEVRVVSMGGRHENDTKEYSVELCGGTHVRATGEIGLFRIISESAVAAGVRRIEAITGAAVLQHLQDTENLVNEAAAHLKVSPAQLPSRLATLLEERKKLQDELSAAKQKLLGNAKADQERIGNITLLTQIAEAAPNDLRKLAEQYKAQNPNQTVIALIGTDAGKASIIVALSNDLTDKFKAPELVKQLAANLGGAGGGGRPDFAQAGGSETDTEKLQAALAQLKTSLAA